MVTWTSTTTQNLSLVQYLYPALGWRCIPPEGLTGRDECLHPPIGPPLRTLVLRNLAPSVARNICATCQDDVPWHGHIYELLHQLRIPERRAPKGLVHSDLGHLDNLLENRQRGVEEHKNLRQLSHHLLAQEHRASARAQRRWSAARCAAEPAPADQTRRTHGLVWSHRRQAPRPRPWQSTGCLPSGEWGSSGSSPCSSTRSSTPRPWPSSVLLRSGAYSLPGPLRRSSAHVLGMSGAVAADVAVQLLNWAAR